MMTRKVIVAFLMLVAASRALACSCGRIPTVAEELRSSEAVFLGKVVAVRDRWTTLSKLWFQLQLKMGRSPAFNQQTYCADVGFEVTFLIERAWKGQSRGRITLLTGRGGGDCGIRFDEGRQYLVYASGIGKPVCNVGGCTRTGAADRAATDIRTLLSITTGTY